MTTPRNTLPFWPGQDGAIESPWPDARCVYCNGRGKVYSTFGPDRQCLICKGTKVLPAPACPICEAPVLDDDTKVFSVAGKLVHPSGRAAHLDCLPITKPEEG